MTKDYLENEYDEIIKLQTYCTETLKEIDKRVKELRIKEVQRTLDFISHHCLNEPNKINTYITHCQNCLNGNIDGVFLSLKDEVETEETVSCKSY